MRGWAWQCRRGSRRKGVTHHPIHQTAKAVQIKLHNVSQVVSSKRVWCSQMATHVHITSGHICMNGHTGGSGRAECECSLQSSHACSENNTAGLLVIVLITGHCRKAVIGRTAGT